MYEVAPFARLPERFLAAKQRHAPSTTHLTILALSTSTFVFVSFLITL